MIGFILPVFLRLGLSQRLAKVAAWAALVIAVAALCVGLWLFFDSREKVDDTANQQIGRTEERAEQQAETIQNVEKANEAREEIRAPGPVGDRARYDQCMRSARNPENCRFLLPERQTD